jgi:hypothetical protein
MHGVGRLDQGRHLHNRRNLPGAYRQKLPLGIGTETERPNTRGVFQRQDIVQVTIGLRLEDLSPDRPLDEDPAPPVRTTILEGPEKRAPMMRPRAQRQVRRIDGGMTI